jgi:hypothetical protein
VDVTGVVVQTLNAWYPPKDAQGNLVDVSKLPRETPATPGNTQPPPIGGGVPPKQ